MNSMYLDALPMYKFQLKYLPEHGLQYTRVVAPAACWSPSERRNRFPTRTMAPPAACSYSSLQSATLPVVHLLPGRLPTHGVHGTAPAAGAATSTHGENRVVGSGVHLGWHVSVHGGVHITVHGSVYV